MTTALEAIGLGKRYGLRRWALRDLDLAVEEGIDHGPRRAERLRQVDAAQGVGRLRTTDGRAGSASTASTRCGTAAGRSR